MVPRKSFLFRGLAAPAFAILSGLACGGSTDVPPLPPPQPAETAEAPPPPPSPPGPLYPAGNECHNRSIEGAALVEDVKPAVVRIQSDLGTGTGSVIRTPKDDEVLMLTAAHVATNAHSFTAFVSTGVGEPVQLAGLEVVKIDTRNDIALLRAGRLPGFVKGLYLNPAGVKTGQAIAAVGFPYVPGMTKFELNFGRGTVSAASVERDGRELVQADLPLNPGNSGGPVLDGCGAVVGVVSARIEGVERVQVLVPVSKVIALYDLYAAPRPPADAGVRAQLALFEKAIQRQEGSDAAAVFSQSFLDERVVPAFRAHLFRINAQLQDWGVNLNSRLEEQVGALRLGLVPKRDQAAFLTFILLKADVIGEHEALKLYLSTWVSDAFGRGVRSIKVDDVTDATSTTATAWVTITNEGGPSLLKMAMGYEWGDWRIKSIECKRGC